MTDKVKDYLKKNPPKGARSRLFKHREMILELHMEQASLRQICQFLIEEQGVKITPKNLSMFIYKMLSRPIVPVIKIPMKTISKPVPKVVLASDEAPEWTPKIKPGFGLYEP